MQKDSESAVLVKTSFLDNAHLRRDSHPLILPGLRRRDGTRGDGVLIVFWERLSSATSPAGGKKMPLGIMPWVDLRSVHRAAATTAFGGTFPGAKGARKGAGAVGRQQDCVGAAGQRESSLALPAELFPCSLDMFTIISTIRVNLCANHQLWILVFYTSLLLFLILLIFLEMHPWEHTPLSWKQMHNSQTWKPIRTANIYV